MSIRSRALSLILAFSIAGAISSNGSAVAAEKDSEAMIKQGVAMRRAGNDEGALEVFRRAHAAEPSGRAAGQLGLCEQALGLWVPAETHLRAALDAGDDLWVRKNRDTLKRSLDSVSARLATLEVRGEPDGAEVELDGEPLGTLPIARPMRVPAGQSRLVVTAPGHVRAIRTILTNPGQHTRETVVLAKQERAPAAVEVPVTAVVESAPPAALRADEPSDSRPVMRTLAWTAAGLSAATLGLAVVQHVAGVRRADEFGAEGVSTTTMDTRCDADLADAGGSECRRLLDARDKAFGIAIPAYIASGVLAVGSATFFWLSRAEPKRGGDQASACGAGPGLVGVSCQLSF